MGIWDPYKVLARLTPNSLPNNNLHIIYPSNIKNLFAIRKA